MSKNEPPKVDGDLLARLLDDLLGRSGVDYAVDDCREFMEEDCPELLEALDAALKRGRWLRNHPVGNQIKAEEVETGAVLT